MSRNQIRACLEQQRQNENQDQNQNQDQEDDEDKSADENMNTVNFASTFNPNNSNFEAMREDDKNTKMGSCYIAPKSESIFEENDEENWFGISNMYACCSECTRNSIESNDINLN